MKKKLLLSLLSTLSFLCTYSETPSKTPFAQNVEAITSLAWPLLALVVFCILYPHIRNIIKSKSFSIKVAGMEVNVQNMADQLSEQIHELQKKTIELACEIEDNIKGKQGVIMPPNAAHKKNWRVLWVTGKHENHAFEISYLERDGVEVIRANSTKEAMEILEDQQETIDAIVTGVRRKENDVVNPEAGISLIRRVKKAGYEIPVFVMCSEQSIQQYYSQLKAEGAIEATSWSLDLISFLKGAGINCSRQQKVLRENFNGIETSLKKSS